MLTTVWFFNGYFLLSVDFYLALNLLTYQLNSVWKYVCIKFNFSLDRNYKYKTTAVR